MVVTFSRMYGSGALGVGRRVAAALGVPVIDQELPVLVATRLGIAPGAAEQVVAEPKPLVERILEGLAISSPEGGTPDDIDEDVSRGVETAIREAAAVDCVILGRAAGIVLAGRPDLFRVFVHAPLAWRAQRIGELLRCDERTARSEIARVDRARAAYLRERYKVDWTDATRYELAIDTSVLGIEGTAQVIAGLVRGRA
jgi:cytidylate kinase